MFIKRLLMPDEKILFRGRVHYIIFLPGALYIGVALAFACVTPGIMESPGALRYFAELELRPEAVKGFLKFTSFFFFIIGTMKVLNALTLAASTELVVTDRRVIAKKGITTTTTLEIDCSKITSVLVHQTPLGQILNYGWVELQGFSGVIRGLPVLAKPYKLQQIVNRQGSWR